MNAQGVERLFDGLPSISLTTDLTLTAALTVTGAITLTGDVALTGDLTLADAQNIVLNTTTGTKIGTATGQKLGFYNATPVVQPTALTAPLNSGTVFTYTAAGTPDYAFQDVTNTNAWGFQDAEEARTFIAFVENNYARLDELETRLQNLGLLA